MPSSRSLVLALATAGLVAGAVLAVPEAALAWNNLVCNGEAPSDFNGDGYADAAIPEGAFTTGQLHVIYGTPNGLTAGAQGSVQGDQLFPAPGAQWVGGYGLSVVSADFDGDGCGDLAVGEPYGDVGSATEAGKVFIYWGGPDGLQDTTVTITAKDATGGTARAGDWFGSGLAAGDVNGDGLPDLIVSAFQAGPNLGGGLYVFPGATSGFPATGRVFNPGDGTIPGSPQAHDEFGKDLATGDFDGDGLADVAIGVEGYDTYDGAVFVVRGSHANLLSTARSQTWKASTAGVPGVGRYFGSALATGDFNHDGRPDLAIGARYGALATGDTDGGTVTMLFSGGSTGLGTGGSQVWAQDSPGVPGVTEDQDQFGSALAAGDFDGDGTVDLAIGVPGESVDGADSEGAVNVLRGGSAGLTWVESTLWDQLTPGIQGSPEAGDNFGASLAAIQTLHEPRSDLLVGVPDESVNGVDQAGEVEFIPGSVTGLTATGSRAWYDDSSGVKGSPCHTCEFGKATA